MEQMPHLATRLQGLGTTVFSEMTALALEHGAVNLGQGFPDDDPPPTALAAAEAAMHAGYNQYAPGPGVASLRHEIAAHQYAHYGLDYDPDDEVTVTFGATEGVAATLLALCDPGDEVLVLEPTYDAYGAVIAMAGATERRVPLVPPDLGGDDDTATWRLDVDRLEHAVGPRTRVLLLNSPHNPTGTVLDETTLDAVAAVCVRHDLVAVTDEVYEHLVFDGEHVPLATRSGMRGRTVTVSSAGKTFSCTGWKVGWACAPAELTRALRTTKQFLSFSGGTPLQHGIAAALRDDPSAIGEVARLHRDRRDLLVDGLQELGIPVTRSPAAYFVIADMAAVGHDDAERFCRWAPGAVGVATVPVSAFVRDPEPVRSLVRLAICKPSRVLRRGLARLGTLVEERGPAPGTAGSEEEP